MDTTHRHLRFTGTCLSLFLAVGCGGGPDDAPDLGRVTGTVTSKEMPVVGASVTFLPDTSKGTTGPASTAVTDFDGSYTLVGSGGREGAVLGQHKVTISCPMASSSDGEGTPPPPCTLKPELGDVKTTTLSAEVKIGDNVVDFDL